jgi:uncharacterized protein (DUF1015 family)
VATVSPFRGLRYDLSVVGDLASVTSPPYDVISPEALEGFEQMSPYNVVRLILSRDSAAANKYSQAAETLDRWLSQGVLVRDEVDSLTVYEQRFTVAGQERVQRGVLAAVALDDEANPVLPHEHTMPKTVEDRLALLRATRVQLSPVFCVYALDDGSAREVVGRAVASAPLASWRSDDDGVAHRAWTLTDSDDLDRVARTLSEATIVIADGHHRFRTAQQYREERRASDGPGPWDQMLLYLVDASWSGPALLPIHRALAIPPERVLESLSGAFEVEEADDPEPEGLAAEVEVRRSQGRTFALLGRDRAWWLTVADKAAEADALPAERSAVWRDLDVAVVEWFLLRRLLGGAEARYVHTAGEAAEMISSGEAASALLLAPPPFDSVRAVAQAGEAMPSKSTFFIPKPRTGVVIRPLD